MVIVESLKKLCFFFEDSGLFNNEYYEQFIALVDTIEVYGGCGSVENMTLLVNKNLAYDSNIRGGFFNVNNGKGIKEFCAK